ncbi:SigE family RNA polymerase sigma factor [Nocardioides marmoriginsengisoli]|uniref:SigE family RNA polymerase sigma factor n=1 Tax=Nocardioides marmoriginsengisoli TaxID=661483 RepID=UPI001FE36F89|nr:SigE family RNA polymerase sigma factor [Nocardioides marmoriginsengisoli]
MNSIAVISAEESVIDADAALEDLYAGHYARLVRLAVLLLRDQALAEDVVQDSFVAVHQRWRRIDQGSAPAYLARTVVNRSRSALRHRSVVARNRPEPAPDVAPADAPVIAAERRGEVLNALADLPTRQREVLVLRYYLDQSEREIATTLGISQGAVKSHASRGAASLRQTLSQELS